MSDENTTEQLGPRRCQALDEEGTEPQCNRPEGHEGWHMRWEGRTHVNDEQVDRTVALGLASGAVIHSLATLVLGPWAWLVTGFIVLSVYAAIRHRPSALVAAEEPKRITQGPEVPKHDDGCPASMVKLDVASFGLVCACNKRARLVASSSEVLAAIRELGDARVDIEALARLGRKRT